MAFIEAALSWINLVKGATHEAWFGARRRRCSFLPVATSVRVTSESGKPILSNLPNIRQAGGCAARKTAKRRVDDPALIVRTNASLFGFVDMQLNFSHSRLHIHYIP